MNYYIGSTSVIDNLYFPDGREIKNVPGGAGIYALAGAKLWSDEVELRCGIGADYQAIFEAWYQVNHLSMASLTVVDPVTPVTEVHYHEDGERDEISKYGSEHYKLFEFKNSDLLRLATEKCGIYVFRNADETFWAPYLELTDRRATVLWEIAADACNPENYPMVIRVLQQIDVLSINLQEAKDLFQLDSEEAVIARLIQLKVPMIFLRLGKRGQKFIQNGQVTFVPSLTNAKVVDVTGGGNSSTGAVLVGYCQGQSAIEMGNMANQSAIMCLSQYGLPEDIESYRKKLS